MHATLQKRKAILDGEVNVTLRQRSDKMKAAMNKRVAELKEEMKNEFWKELAGDQASELVQNYSIISAKIKRKSTLQEETPLLEAMV